jgi:hypothetical protein
MVVRKKNLLDAFRRAAPEGRLAPPQVTRASSPGGPFAHAPLKTDPAPEPEPPADIDFEAGERAPAPDRRSALARLVADPGFRLILLVAVLIGAGAWLFARFGSKSAQAADASPTLSAPEDGVAGEGVLASGAAGQGAVEKNQAAARLGSPTDQAFMDLGNRFTVRLAQYNNDDGGMRKASETAEFLKKLAIPVVSPIAKGKHIILAAGAKPRASDLDALLKVVKAQHGTGGQEKQLPFASAYIDNIDALVQRR